MNEYNSRQPALSAFRFVVVVEVVVVKSVILFARNLLQFFGFPRIK